MSNIREASLRVSEVYASTQGEGPNVGKPTVFVRFGGCNLRCALWPCDTQHAIDPKYRHEWTKYGVDELAKEITEHNIGNICFTGGEPMLQNTGTVVSLVEHLYDADYSLEMFSNGTLPYPDAVLNKVGIVMDWKLPGSGEKTDVPARVNNYNSMKWAPAKHSVKFTIANRQDYLEARRVYYLLAMGRWQKIEVFAGVVWGHLENAELVQWILDDGLNWRLNVQVHNHVWDRSMRGI